MSNFELHVESGDTLTVRAFTVVEGLAEPFLVHVVARSASRDLDLSKFVGAGAALRAQGGPRSRAWTGICSRADVEEGLMDASGGQTTYVLTIVPHLWLLTQRTNHRVFQHMTAVEMVKVLLTEWNVVCDVRLSAVLPKLELRVQYAETDFAFVSRLLEEAGVTYFFEEHGAEGKTESRVVMTDSPQTAAPRSPDLSYVPELNHVLWENKISKLAIRHVPTHGRATVRDTDLRRSPTAPVFAKAVWKGEPEATELVTFSPGAFLCETKEASTTPVADGQSVARHATSHGEATAAILLEASRSQRERIRYISRCLDLGPGTVFRVTHPRDDVAGKSFLVARVRIEGMEGSEWTLEGEAVSTAFPFRPPVSTPKPTLEGLQSAVVTGPAGKEIHTDEFGRIRVRFLWDREGEYDDTRSPWVRVSHGWAGTGFGFHTIPRVGQEVLLAFQGGNPDMPVVVGRLYSGTQVHPYALPAGKTMSGIKTKSVPGAGYNALVFEDAAGAEALYIKAQRDQVRLVQGSDSEHTAGTASTTTGASHIAVVSGDEQVLVKDVHTVSAGSSTIEIRKHRICITTGATELVIEGPNITIRANDNLMIIGKNGVAIEGKQIFINDGAPPGPYPPPDAAQPAVGASPPATQSRADGALDAPNLEVAKADEQVFRIPGAPPAVPAAAGPAKPGAPGAGGLPSLSDINDSMTAGVSNALGGGAWADAASKIAMDSAKAAAKAAITGGDIGQAALGQAARGVASQVTGAMTGSANAAAVAGKVAKLAASGANLKEIGIGLAADAAGNVAKSAVGDVATDMFGKTVGGLATKAAGKFASNMVKSGGDVTGSAIAAGTAAALAGVGGVASKLGKPVLGALAQTAAGQAISEMMGSGSGASTDAEALTSFDVVSPGPEQGATSSSAGESQAMKVSLDQNQDLGDAIIATDEGTGATVPPRGGQAVTLPGAGGGAPSSAVGPGPGVGTAAPPQKGTSTTLQGGGPAPTGGAAPAPMKPGETVGGAPAPGNSADASVEGAGGSPAGAPVPVSQNTAEAPAVGSGDTLAGASASAPIVAPSEAAPSAVPVGGAQTSADVYSGGTSPLSQPGSSPIASPPDGGAGEAASGARDAAENVPATATAAGTGAAAGGVGAGVKAAVPAIAAGVVGGVAVQATGAALTGKNVGEAIVPGLVGAGVAAGTTAVVSAILPDAPEAPEMPSVPSAPTKKT